MGRQVPYISSPPRSWKEQPAAWGWRGPGGEWPAGAGCPGLGQMALLAACASRGQGLGAWVCTSFSYLPQSSTVNPHQMMLESVDEPEKEVLREGK